jgi:hypothetical protein
MAANRQGPIFNWAQGFWDLAEADEGGLTELVEASGLDPHDGDLSHIDLRDQSIAGEFLTGWNLEFAQLDRCLIKGAHLSGTNLKPDQLITAIGWRHAHVDKVLREETSLLAAQRALAMPAHEFFGEHRLKGQGQLSLPIGEIASDLSEDGAEDVQGVEITLKDFLMMFSKVPGPYWLKNKEIIDVAVDWHSVAAALHELADVSDEEMKNLLLSTHSRIFEMLETRTTLDRKRPAMMPKKVVRDGTPNKRHRN